MKTTAPVLFLFSAFVIVFLFVSIAGAVVLDGRPFSGVVVTNPANFESGGFNQLDEIRLFSTISPNVRANQDGTGNSQNETTIAGNYFNPYNLVGGANDYRNGEVDAGYYYTLDGGLTWNDGTLCCWANLDAQGDPAITADADGNFYYALISFDRYSPDNGIYVCKSTDGGQSWGNPVAVVEHFNDPYAPFEDKEYIAADITNSPYHNNIYVTWTSFDWTNPILFSRSTNGGASFSSPIEISGYDDCQGSIPAVGPNGEIYVAYLAYSNPPSIRLVKSTNGGISFGNEIYVSNVDELPSPLPPTYFRDNSFPSMAVDISGGPYNGYIHIVWADYRNNDADIYYSRSTNGGNTWSTPRRLNDDQLMNGKDQFFPWISCDPDGNVHLFFYDRRDDNNNILINGYYTRSTDGGTTWSSNERVTTASSDPNTDFYGSFIGDYNGITSVEGKAHPLWTDTREGNQDVYTAKIDWGTMPTVTIAMVPDNMPINISGSGGSFTYTGVLGNNYTGNTTVDVWLKLTLPNGSDYGPIERYNNVSLSGGDILYVDNINQSVPSYAPAGEYTYRAYVGDYSSSYIIDSATFKFTKTALGSGGSDEWVLSGWGFEDNQENSGLPKSVMLLSNYPNPFNVYTEINYLSNRNADVRLEVFDLAGRRVADLVDGHQNAGYHSVRWDASNISSGVYFYRLSINGESMTKRMTLIK